MTSPKPGYVQRLRADDLISTTPRANSLLLPLKRPENSGSGLQSFSAKSQIVNNLGFEAIESPPALVARKQP